MDLDELDTARKQVKEREVALSSKADSLEVSGGSRPFELCRYVMSVSVGMFLFPTAQCRQCAKNINKTIQIVDLFGPK